MRVTARGQVAIPPDIRERAGLLPGTEVEFVIDETGAVRVQRPAMPGRNPAAERAVAHLRGAARAGLSTEEIIALTSEWPA